MTGPPPQPGHLDRRSLLAGGLAGLAVGGAGGYGLANRQPHPVPSAGRLAYGPAPSGGDDTGRLQDAVDALPHGGMLLLPPGRYRLTASLVVPPGVQLTGSGGYPLSAQAGTTLAGGGLWFRGGSNGARDLAVAGASVLVGGTGQREAGADCYFANVSVGHAPGDGWVVQGTQNSTFVNCRVQSSDGDGLVLDYSAGGHLFQRFESGGNAGYNLRVRQSRPATRGGYPIPADNTFVACIFEQRARPGPSVLLEDVDATAFLHCAFSDAPGRRAAGDTAALVEIRSGRSEFGSPVVFAEPGRRAAFGVRGTARVAVSGVAQIGGGAAAFADVDASASLLLDGTVLGLHADTPAVATTLLTPETPAASVTSHRQASLVVDRDVSARRYVTPTVTTTLRADGPVQLDASAGQRQVVLLDGHDLTGLSIANAVDGQSLALVLLQGPRVGRVALPGAAAGFRWSGGDARRPTLTSADGYLAVELVALQRQWFELARAGTDVR